MRAVSMPRRHAGSCGIVYVRCIAVSRQLRRSIDNLSITVDVAELCSGYRTSSRRPFDITIEPRTRWPPVSDGRVSNLPEVVCM